jgi:hypothetical protein
MTFESDDFTGRVGRGAIDPLRGPDPVGLEGVYGLCS